MAVVLVGIALLVFVIVVVLDVIRNKRNPTPLMCNDDKRFIFVNNVKTRKMYEGIKR